MIPNFTPRSQQVIATAKKLAKKHKSQTIENDHLFLALLQLDSFLMPFLINKYNLDVESLINLVEDSLHIVDDEEGPQSIPFSQESKNCLELAYEFSSSRSHSYISIEHLLYALLVQENSIIPEFFLIMDVDVEDLKNFIEKKNYTITGPAIVAQYNSPWAIPPFRHNEIIIEIKERI